MTRLARWLLVGLFAVLCSASVWAQQPVQALGNGAQNTSLASWTSSTSTPTCVTPVSSTSQYNSALVVFVTPSGLTGGVVTFKESLDNSNWFIIQGVALGTTTIVGPTYTLTASSVVAFAFPLEAAPYFEVCLTTAITGSGTTTVQDGLQTLPQAALLAGTQTLAAGSNVIGGVTGSGVFEVGPTTAANTATNPFFHEVTDGTNVMGAMANFGTSPGAVKAQHVNASLFIGTTLVSSSNPFPISATGAANTKTNPIFANPTDGTNSLAAAISALGTAPTGTDVMAVNNVALPSAAAGAAPSLSSQSSLTTAVVVKSSAGNLYGFAVTNASASVCYLQFINVASSPTLGTTALFSIPIPASGNYVATPNEIPLAAFSAGISVGMSTAYNGSSACGSAATAVIFYK
jgi:hypothetical protein